MIPGTGLTAMVDGDVDRGASLLYRQENTGYPIDLRDAEWPRSEPLIPDASRSGRLRKTDRRVVMNAILCLLRTGCPWHYLPRDSFPPTTSFASSSVMASGRHLGRGCI